MVRLYKAVFDTGATVQIDPCKDICGVLVTFLYKGHKYRKPYCLELLEYCGKGFEDSVIGELIHFVNYVDALNEECVCG